MFPCMLPIPVLFSVYSLLLLFFLPLSPAIFDFLYGFFFSSVTPCFLLTCPVSSFFGFFVCFGPGAFRRPDFAYSLCGLFGFSNTSHKMLRVMKLVTSLLCRTTQGISFFIYKNNSALTATGTGRKEQT